MFKQLSQHHPQAKMERKKKITHAHLKEVTKKRRVPRDRWSQEEGGGERARFVLIASPPSQFTKV